MASSGASGAGRVGGANETVSPWRITLADLDYGVEEEAAVLRVLRSKWLSMGPEVEAFEEEFADAHQVKHAIAIANGTDALMLSLLALGIGVGDEVVQPAVNFVASANVTMRAGAMPVFADIVSLENPTIQLASIEARVTPRTKAIVVMHYGGAACAMEDIMALARERRIAVIEDACHGVGGSYAAADGNGEPQPMGSVGDIGTFSFFSNKNLAIGEGGMLTTQRDDLAAKLRALRSHGMTTLTWDRHRGHARTYDVTVNGLNARMDELRAALGRVQLAKLAGHNVRRRELAREYQWIWKMHAPTLEQAGWLLPSLGAETDHGAHHLQIALAPDEAARDGAMARLKAARIQSSIHYPFIPDFTAFRPHVSAAQRAALPNAEAFCKRVITLPLHPLLTYGDVSEVVQTLAAPSG